MPIAAAILSSIACANAEASPTVVYRYSFNSCGPFLGRSTCEDRPLAAAFAFTTPSILSAAAPPTGATSTPAVTITILDRVAGNWSDFQIQSFNVGGFLGLAFNVLDAEPAAGLNQTGSVLSLAPLASALDGVLSLPVGRHAGFASSTCLSLTALGDCVAATTVQALLTIDVEAITPPPPPVPGPAALGLLGLGAAVLQLGRRHLSARQA